MRFATLLAVLLLVVGTAGTNELGVTPNKTDDHIDGIIVGGDRDAGDTIEEAWVVAGLPFTGTGNTCLFNDDYDEACPYTGSVSPDVVYAFAPSADMPLVVDLCDGWPDSYDTKTYVYEDAVGNVIDCDDDGCGPAHGYASYISNAGIFAGHTYYVVVDGYGGDCGYYLLKLYEDDPEAVCCRGLVCTIEPEQSCADTGGDWYPLLESCDPNSCSAVCCVETDCYLVTEDECAGMGGRWRPELFSCDPNPCCSPGCYACIFPEGEPKLEDEYIDTHNGGCDSNPPVFQYIHPRADGTRDVCCMSGTYTYGGETLRDTDWFVCYAEGGPLNVSITPACGTEILQLGFDPVLRCDGPIDTIQVLQVDICETRTLEINGAPGEEIWFMVRPDDLLFCPGHEYLLEVDGITWEPAACCIESDPMPQCLLLTTEECDAIGGVYRRQWEECIPNICHPYGPPCAPLGCDHFDSTTAVFLFRPVGLGREIIIATGPTTVVREAPLIVPPDGHCEIETEMIELHLEGIYDPAGCDPSQHTPLPVVIELDTTRVTRGLIRSSHDDAGNPDFPDYSDFHVFVDVTIEGLGRYKHEIPGLVNTLDSDNLWHYPPCLEPDESPYEAGYPNDGHLHLPCPTEQPRPGCCRLPAYYGLGCFVTDPRICGLLEGTFYGPGSSCPPPDECCPIEEIDDRLDELPATLSLEVLQNPTVSAVTIQYQIDRAGPVALEVFDSSGRRVRTLLDQTVPAGEHTLQWDGLEPTGSKLSPGIYFIRLCGEEGAQVKRAVIMR
ncbi:FlgD immunoglobulin-like domain containing protein [Candidatus Eisenbacteria bacterium]|uniref:FlgD immunoglobulin-like domain containing protein n=1 Tax=Eiseniibacteriota bacterium TaxID=2212470 RepID=A0ABV6YLL9_UNCEI